ncbi:MAG: hypothetical protein ABI616_06315 [Pseudomonadota bacterium]
MKTRKQCLAAGFIAALTIPLAVHAADPPHCNDIFEDAQRLGCYDAVFGKPIHSAATSTAAAPVAPLAVAAGATAATAVIAAPQAAPQKKDKAAKPVSFKASVTTLSQSADGRFIATLDNGQKWLQTEKDSRDEVKVGDTVTLQPMMFGAWSLVTKSGYLQRVKPLN